MPQDINTPPIKKPAQVYIITGEDGFRKKLCIDRLKEKILGKNKGEFDYCLYYAKDSLLSDIMDFLRTFSVSGSNKLAVIIEPENFSEEDKALFAGFLKNLRKGAFTILVGGKTSRLLTAFVSMISGYAEKTSLSALSVDDMSAWITGEFKKTNKKISRKSADIISESAAGDTARALSITEQVSTFLGDRETVTEDDVRLFVDSSANVTAFNMLDFISAKMPDKALGALNELIITEPKPEKIVGLLAWHIARLIHVKSMLACGISRPHMISELKISQYALTRLISQAEEFTMKKLKTNLEALSQTDILIKRSSFKGPYLLEALIVKLAG